MCFKCYLQRKVESVVLDFSWKVFSMTGNVDMYLLMKEIERDSDQQFEQEITLLNEDFNSPPNH